MLVLNCISLNPAAATPGGPWHETNGYHLHRNGQLLECSNVEACRQILLPVLTSEDACYGAPVVSFEHEGPHKYYTSHWWLDIFTRCEGINGLSHPSQHRFYWYLNEMPAECDQGEDPPYCPFEGPQYALEATPEPEPPGECTSLSNPTDETNPCNPANGNKSQTEIDFKSPAPGGLQFARYYNSKGSYKTAANMAPGWRHTYSARLDEEPDRKPSVKLVSPVDQSSYHATAADACTSGWSEIKDTVWSGSLATGVPSFAGGNTCSISIGGSTVAHFPVRSAVGWGAYSPPPAVKTVTLANGAALRFEYDGSSWSSLTDPSLVLEPSGTNWVLTDSNDSRQTFDASGRLVSVARRNGQTETLDYDLSTAEGGDDNGDTLDRVTGPFGHEITFDYDGNGYLASTTTPDGTIQYAYGSDDNLVSVTYPDATTRQYLYQSLSYAGTPNLLIGLIDENNNQYATWEYDTAGRAVLSEHAGGQRRVELVYNSDGTTTLNMANGATRTYTYETVEGRRKLISVSGDVCSTCPGGNVKNRDYDSNGFVAEITDWNDVVTKTARNSRGLTETLTEAFGTPEQRTTTTIWHPSFRLPTQVTSPKSATDYTHDANGNILSITLSGGALSRSWAFTYNANGQVLTVDGPRTDVSDITTFEYYDCASGNACGQLERVTNALGHVSTFDSYDSAGRLTQMTDANGLQSSYTFDARGRLLTATETPPTGTALVTTMTYDAVGQVETVTMPNGTVLTYAYDAAHYLTSVTDNLGNSINYEYDAMGNLIDEDTKDPTSTLKRALDYTYDLNYRLDTVSDGGFTTDLTYDLVGNLTAEQDPNTNTTQHIYDGLDRLSTTIDALTGVVSFGYDDHDNLTQVVAANGATTSYVYDDLDNLVSETSPDRGLITYTYDSAGNRLTSIDARGVEAVYTYDALNRLLSVSYPTAAENVSYTYDNAASNGLGRLHSIVDQSGTTTYTYDAFGRVSGDTRVISGTPFSTSYTYDGAGNVASITYPSGREVSYSRDSVGNISQVHSDFGGTQKSVVSNADYEPFGPLSSLTYGNNVSVDYTRRTDYRITSIFAASGIDKSYVYDGAGNITNIIDANDTSRTQYYEYDVLNRLTSDTWSSTAAYADSVLADSPVVYWRLGESMGSVAADMSGNGYDASYSGTMTLGEPGLVAGADTAARNATSGAGLVVGPQMVGASLTGVEMWFATDDVSVKRDLFRVYESGSVRTHVFQGTSGKISLWINGIKYSYLVSDSAISVGQPHHIAVWYDAASNTSFMMIDGTVQARTYAGNVFAAADPNILVAGYYRYGLPESNYLGVIDEVAAYTTAVDASTFAARLNVTESTASNDLAYDSNGNRTSLDDGSAVINYTYDAYSNRMNSINSAAIQHDAAGNRIAEPGGIRTYVYNDASRLVEVLDNSSTVAAYQHNALGQRTSKTVGTETTVFIYDLLGNVLAEHDTNGALIRDYVWMNGMPVAQIDQGEVFSYVHFDHLGTPRHATDDSQSFVWSWEGDAFGVMAANEDPDGDTILTVVNLRFAGQYFDIETGFHYNYFRTFDPSTGRYLESDPIGLIGGLNTYAYVDGDPLGWSDHFGLRGTRSFNLYSPNGYPASGNRYGVPPLQGLQAIRNPSNSVNPLNPAARSIVESAIANASSKFSWSRMDADVALAGLEALNEFGQQKKFEDIFAQMWRDIMGDPNRASDYWNNLLDDAEMCTHPDILEEAKLVPTIGPWMPLR